jgi:hypothetical protein
MVYPTPVWPLTVSEWLVIQQNIQIIFEKYLDFLSLLKKKNQ